MINRENVDKETYRLINQLEEALSEALLHDPTNPLCLVCGNHEFWGVNRVDYESDEEHDLKETYQCDLCDCVFYSRLTQEDFYYYLGVNLPVIPTAFMLIQAEKAGFTPEQIEFLKKGFALAKERQDKEYAE
jgi:hypothetical protein